MCHTAYWQILCLYPLLPSERPEKVSSVGLESGPLFLQPSRCLALWRKIFRLCCSVKEGELKIFLLLRKSIACFFSCLARSCLRFGPSKHLAWLSLRNRDGLSDSKSFSAYYWVSKSNSLVRRLLLIASTGILLVSK